MKSCHSRKPRQKVRRNATTTAAITPAIFSWLAAFFGIALRRTGTRLFVLRNCASSPSRSRSRSSRLISSSESSSSMAMARRSADERVREEFFKSLSVELRELACAPSFSSELAERLERPLGTTSSYCVNSIESRAIKSRSTELCASTNQYIRFHTFFYRNFRLGPFFYSFAPP